MKDNNPIPDLSNTTTFERVMQLGGLSGTRYRVYILIIATCVVFTTVYSFLAPNKYTAQTTLFQRDFSFLDQNMFGGALLSSLTSMQTQSPIDHFALVMTSRPVARMMIARQGIDKIIFAEQWDIKAKAWQPKPGILSWMKRQINLLFGLPAWSPPDDQDVADFISDKISNTLSEADGTLELSYDNKDPGIAALVLKSLYEDTNEVIQQDQVTALGHVFNVVSERLNGTNNVALKNSITDLASQSLVEMTKASAKTIEVGVLNPIRVSPVPTSPKPILNAFIGILIGALTIAIWRLYELVGWMLRSRLKAA